MGKIEKFFGTYFQEIGFVVVLAYFVGMTMYGADKETVNGSVYCALSLGILTTLFCLYVVLLGYKALSLQRILCIKKVAAYSATATFGALLAYSCYLQQAFSVDEIIKLGCFAVVAGLLCRWYLNMREDNIRYMEQLHKWQHPDYLRKMIKQERLLTDYEQLKVFDLFDAEKLICDYMHYAKLGKNAEQKLIEQPYVVKVLENLPLYSFSEDGDALLFCQPEAEKLVLLYVQNGNTFSAKNELKMFELPNAAEVLREYIIHSSLTSEAELLLLELSYEQKSDLADIYAGNFGFCKEVVSIAKERGWL